MRKRLLLDSKRELAKEPPLRFAVGDEVVVLHEADNSKKRGTVVELYYRERSFALDFTAPYRVLLFKGPNTENDPPEYTWIKADIDRYIRKVGVKSIEDTRFRARLDDKVKELADVYCSKEFIQGIYHTLVQDLEFVESLRSEWNIELSEPVLYLYRVLVMYKRPLIITDSGYHIPTADEVIAGIMAYFDPAEVPFLDAPFNEVTASQRTKRAEVAMMQRFDVHLPDEYQLHTVATCKESKPRLFWAAYSDGWCRPAESQVDLLTLIENGFSIPPPAACVAPKVAHAFSMATKCDHFLSIAIDNGFAESLTLDRMWVEVFFFLDSCVSEQASECPFIYFFVKYCLDHGMGVPKLALAVYDRMNMQLSRKFIQCANPSCECNKLNKSIEVTFKKCNGCLAVVYCSRECQVAHYPEHKKLCGTDNS